MGVLYKLKTIFGEHPRVICERGHIAVHLWTDVHGDGTVCTVGMSGEAQVVAPGHSCPSREPRTELMALCRTSNAEILGSLLLDLAAYPFEHGEYLFWYQIVPLGKTLVTGSNVEGVLLSMPPIRADEMTFTNDGHRIDIVWVVPILLEEMDNARRNGIQALEDYLENSNIDVADVRRPKRWGQSGRA